MSRPSFPTLNIRSNNTTTTSPIKTPPSLLTTPSSEKLRLKLDNINSILNEEKNQNGHLQSPFRTPNELRGSNSWSSLNGLNSRSRKPNVLIDLNDINFNDRFDTKSAEKYNEIMQNAGYLFINGERLKTKMDDLKEICELGSGTCGRVIKTKHEDTGQLMAVKQMRLSGNAEENKRVIMDLDVVLKCNSCPYIVSCLGYFISNNDVWICMDLMSMCFDKVLKKIKRGIPEEILGKLTICTLNALNYLKEQHNVIHRDIKPSNLLINENGEIKLCDFGISGNLVESKAETRSAGCAGYLSPERIDLDINKNYDIRADVWSLGITLVELASGQYPYSKCKSDFEVMSAIAHEDPPKLDGEQFSENFKRFVKQCLIKEVSKRPKYGILLQDPFALEYKDKNVDVKSWFANVLKESSNDRN